MNPEMIKRLKKMQDEMEKKQRELNKKEFTVEKQGVIVVINGASKITKIEIDEALVDPEDKDIIEELLVIAINEAYDLVAKEQEKLMPQMPGGLPF